MKMGPCTTKLHLLLTYYFQTNLILMGLNFIDTRFTTVSNKIFRDNEYLNQRVIAI